VAGAAGRAKISQKCWYREKTLMPLPLVGAHAVLDGMPEFNKNADIINSKVGGIHDKMSGLGGVSQKASGLVSGAFKAMATAGVASVAGIGAVGGGLLKIAYDAANLPGIQSVFSNMTASMGVDAEALMGKMRAASYGAVKDFDLMKQANKAMVGAGEEFGKMFAESLPTLMKVSREAAKAQGLSVEYMYDSIVTGVKRMSPMILDNLGFQLSLTEANERYAQSIGKSSKELNKQEKQMALLQEVMRAGNQLLDETGGHVDSIQKDVQSWKTAMANVKDQIGIQLLPVLQKFMDLIGKPSQGMQDAIIKATKAFVDWLLPAIDKVAMAIQTFMQGPLVGLIRGLSSIGFGGLADIGEAVSAILTGKDMDFTSFGELMAKALTPAFGKDIASKIGQAAASLATTIQDALAPIRDRVQEVIDWVRPRMEILPTYFKMAIKGIMEAFSGKGFDTLITAIRNSLMVVFGIQTERKIEKFVGYFKQAADWILQYSDVIIGAIKGIIAVLAAKELIGGISNLASVAKTALGGVGRSALGLLGPMGLVVGGAALLGVAWEKNWFDIQGKTAKVVDTVKKILGGLGTELEGGIFDWNSILPPNLAEVMKTVSGVVVGIRDTIQGGDFPWEDVLPPDLASIAYGIVDAFENVQRAVSGIGDIIGALFSGDQAKALTSLQDMVRDIFGPDAADMVVPFLDTMTEAFDQFKAMITEVLTTVYDALMEIWPTIQSIALELGTLLGNAFSTILAVAQAVWPSIQSIITTVWDAVSEVFNIFLTTIWPALLAGFQGLLAWVNDNWPAIQEVIVTVFRIVGEVIAAVAKEVIPFVISVFQGLVDWVKENWPAIQETIRVVMEFIGNVIKIVLDNIQQFWQEHGDNIMSIITLVWDWIKSTIQTAIDVVKGIISLVMAIIRGDWKSAWDAIKDIVSKAWEWIKKTVDTAIKLLGDIIAIGWGLIKTGVEVAWDTIKLLISMAWDNIKKNVEAAINAVKKTLTDTMDEIKKGWEDAWNGIAQIVKNVWNSILDFVAKGLNGAIDLLNGLINAANKVPGVRIGLIPHVDVSPLKLAEGGILNRSTFVAGEEGAEVVAPITKLVRMMQEGLESAITNVVSRSSYPYSGPQPSITNNYGGDTYVKEYNLTAQSVIRPGGLALEFAAMELAHA
jgi:phage-related protein/roadblock/LC7 domain-containing protein